MGAALRCRVGRAVGRHISQGLQGRPVKCASGGLSAQSPPSVHRDEQAPPVTHPIQVPAPFAALHPLSPLRLLPPPQLSSTKRLCFLCFSILDRASYLDHPRLPHQRRLARHLNDHNPLRHRHHPSASELVADQCAPDTHRSSCWCQAPVDRPLLLVTPSIYHHEGLEPPPRSFAKSHAYFARLLPTHHGAVGT